MNNNWYTILDLSINNFDQHLTIFNLLLDNESKILFRDETADYSKFNSAEFAELLDDTYESYLLGIMYIKNDEKEQLDIEIKKLLSKFYKKDILSTIEFLKSENIDTELLHQIKILIYNSNPQTSSKNHDIIFINEPNVSFRSYISGGDHIENPDYLYSWYCVSREDLKNQFEKDMLYNAIITKDLNCFNNYLYYINFIENPNFILAINDNKNQIQCLLPKIEQAIGGSIQIKYEGKCN